MATPFFLVKNINLVIIFQTRLQLLWQGCRVFVVDVDIKIPLSQWPCKSSRQTTKLLFDWYDFSPFSWDTTPLNIWHLTKKASSVAGQKVFRWCKNINNLEMARARRGIDILLVSRYSSQYHFMHGKLFPNDFEIVMLFLPESVCLQFINSALRIKCKNISQWIEVYLPHEQFYDRGNVLVLGLGNNKTLLSPIQKRRHVYNIGWEINAELPRLSKWQHLSKIHKSEE